ncbi:hypothetical protein IKS57_01895, partial [bacterium]|nr:hypothetical protein [bacterium]
YIDTDTIINGNIEELWNIDLKDNVIAGVHEGGEWNKHLNTYGMNDTYINSGVLLMNLKAIREEKLDDSMIYLLNHNHYWFPDQDVINLVCRNRVYQLENIYNSTETTGFRDDAKIIHYIRGNKGWIKSSPRSDIWYKYHYEMLGGDNMYKVGALFDFDDVTVQDKDGKNVKRIAYQNVPEVDREKYYWEVSKERYEYLKEHNAVELIEIIPIEQPKVETNKKKTTKKGK